MFQRYRPQSHVIAKRSFMNDPCSFAYIQETGEYLLCYQWSERAFDNYGEAYGTCSSNDLVVWHDKTAAIQRGHATYDQEACFSGSIFQRKEQGKTVLYLFYTSVSSMPISWKLPYKPGCETQSLAVSYDFGRTWRRHAANPLLKAPPAGINTTGWRDPFVSIWPAMAALRGKSPETTYMTLSSGTRDGGPCVMLYESDDLIHWTGLGPLFSAAKNAPLAPPVPGIHYGVNFECVSFASIGDSLYLFCGVESDTAHTTRHDGHFLFWHRGRLEDPTQPRFVPVASGTMDHDILYAIHTTQAKDGLIQLGWADEDDNKHKIAQDWSGVLGLPRKVFEITAPKQEMVDAHAWTIQGDTMTTLGLDVYDGMTRLRAEAEHLTGHQLAHVKLASFELELRLPVTDLIVTLRKSDQEATRILIDKTSITLDRSRSSLDNGNAQNRSGAFQLLKDELLHLRVFCDQSLLEIYVNGRFCMTSRIYPSPEALDIAVESSQAIELNQVHLYHGLQQAWPGRVASSLL